MKLSYVLYNKDGRSTRIPLGKAWQWTYNLQVQEQLDCVLSWVGARVSVDRLDLLNVYLDNTEITALENVESFLKQTPQIVHSRVKNQVEC